MSFTNIQTNRRTSRRIGHTHTHTHTYLDELLVAKLGQGCNLLQRVVAFRLMVHAVRSGPQGRNTMGTHDGNNGTRCMKVMKVTMG